MEKTIISANTLVEEVVLIFSILFSLRQHYLDQVRRVDNTIVVLSAGFTQLPMHLINKEMVFLVFKLYWQLSFKIQ